MRVNHGTAVNAYMNALFLDEGRDPDVRIKLDVDTVSAWVQVFVVLEGHGIGGGFPRYVGGVSLGAANNGDSTVVRFHRARAKHAQGRRDRNDAGGQQQGEPQRCADLGFHLPCFLRAVIVQT